MTKARDDLLPLLRELIKLPQETEWVEFKHNTCDPDLVGEYVSAISNSAALSNKTNGYIVWGISDTDHRVVGTTFRPTRSKVGNENLENWLARLLSPSVHVRFFEFVFEGKDVTLAEIRRAVHQPVRFKNTDYVRIGSYKKKLRDHPESERELWRIFDAIPYEQQVAAERLSESQVLELLDYPQFFKLLEMPLPENRRGILERLQNNGMIQPREDGRWDILNLGAILFASKLSRFDHLSRKQVRVIEYADDSRINTKREKDNDIGYAAGFETLIGFVKGLLPENEVIGEALRKTVPMYPEIAIRELIANAIIHQDFTMTGCGPMIEVFDQRLEIMNPGLPLMDTMRFLDTPPRSRNEALASFLRRIGVCEERGSGIDKVVFQTEFYQLPAPKFETSEDHTKATLFAHRSFALMEKDDRVRACYLHACLQYVNNKRMTNTSLRQRFGIEEKNRAQVSRIINDTVDAGLVRPYDPESSSRKHAKYVPFWV